MLQIVKLSPFTTQIGSSSFIIHRISNFVPETSDFTHLKLRASTMNFSSSECLASAAVVSLDRRRDGASGADCLRHAQLPPHFI